MEAGDGERRPRSSDAGGGAVAPRATPTTVPHGLAWADRAEEVRLAMGWNGGVSLAVWMGGVAVELDEARRAVPRSDGPARTTAELYAAVCAAFDRRLVIDILAGASAGGLNGAFLAGVIAHKRTLDADFLRRRWLDIGDFGQLLQPLENKKPASVMQGTLFLQRLNAAFHDLLGTDMPPPPPSDGSAVPVQLDVQVTNVIGEERSFVDDWDEPFYALEYRAPLRFREWSHFTTRFLATAARASASFPAAFESQEIEPDVAALAGLGPHTRWAIDGGLLENAPIRPAIEAIPYRLASGPVRRYVCYVNAAPTAHREQPGKPGQPSLAQVLGYTINLPRDGRVVDQLQALDDATRRTGLTADAGLKLLSVKGDALTETANQLLPTYQRRRATLSLEELLAIGGTSGPGRARQALKNLATDAGDATDLAAGARLLPWIPTTLDAPGNPSEWRWGIRAAQRVIQLELDALRAVLLASKSTSDARAIFEARESLDHAILRLELQRASFSDPEGPVANATRRLLGKDPADRRRALGELSPPTHGAAQQVSEWLSQATGTFYKTLKELTEAARNGANLASLDQLFGTGVDKSDELTPDAYGWFLKRALGVETVRRSFADDFDIETAQSLRVAQLTPLVPAPLFARGNPNGPTSKERPPAGADAPLGPQTTKDKLAGIRVNHFAGFYRRSWRANDFMWGRLDGATAIARLLIDPDRARALETNGKAPWKDLATALTPTSTDNDQDRERAALLEEILPPNGQGELSQRLAETLRHDLTAPDNTGDLTRLVVARAIQYAILADELPHIIQAADDDRAAGAYITKLTWKGTGPLNDVIKALRQGQGKTALPGLLGAGDPDEATSTLALRTISHAVLVALGALAGAVPLTRALQPARVPFLTVRGATALRPLDRLAVVLGFTGTAWFVAARLLTLTHPTTDPGALQRRSGTVVPLDSIWSAPVLTYWACILAIVGLAAIPILRTARAQRWRRRTLNAFYAIAFLATGGAMIFVYQFTNRSVAQVLTTWDAPQIAPSKLLWLVVAAAGIHAASTFDSILRYAALLHRPIKNLVSTLSLAFGALTTVLAFYAAEHGLPTWHDGPWQKAAIILAACAPLTALTYLRLWSGWRNLKAAQTPPARTATARSSGET